MSIRDTFHRPWAALAVAASFVLVDLGGCYWHLVWPWHRLLLASTGATAIAWLSGFDWRALGLTLRPIQGYGYWAKAGAAIGTAVLAFLVLVLVGAKVVGLPLSLRALPPGEAFSFLFYACLGAPLHEELMYRLVLCLPLTAVAGPRATIIIGGAIFAALHFVYGNPAPDNIIAGFFLCWAYLKSGTLLVPMIFHSIGNGFAIAIRMGTWYWTN